MPPLLAQLSEKTKPCPGYFLVRPTGEVVPLIAVDELPPGTNLEGVSRSLDLEDTIGMLNLGIQRGTGTFYRMAKPEETKEASAGLPTRTRPPSEVSHSVNAMEAQISSPHKQQLRNSTTSSLPSGPHGSLNHHHPPRAEPQICRHWCTHGICKWGQQCRYRHIMPMTLPGLQEVGLTDWPAWYRALDPGCFASERPGPNRRIRPRASICAGNGCCGGTNNGASGVIHGHSGLRGLAAVQGRLRRENLELGEQILERLRTLPKEGKRVAGKAVRNDVMLDKAAKKE